MYTSLSEIVLKLAKDIYPQPLRMQPDYGSTTAELSERLKEEQKKSKENANQK